MEATRPIPERPLVKVACGNSIGYYTQFKDAMKEGEKIYVPDDSEGDGTDPGDELGVSADNTPDEIWAYGANLEPAIDLEIKESSKDMMKDLEAALKARE
ncbi:MAG: hypothetical protein JRC86_00380 [Deltaproteobacteria bacterium]|nr:hypothetical protein [Deltaproteobacteria bacterium]